MIRVELTTAEIRIVQWIAKQRRTVNRAADVPDAKVGPQSADRTDLIGFGAELAFAKLFNVYPDFSIGPRRGSADCERFGEAIDVKATEYAHGQLLAVRGKVELAADVYALMVVDWPIFYFAGFARANVLLAPERLKNLGHGDTYAIEQSELRADQIRWG